MLTVREHMFLEFEGRTYRHIGVKEQQIRDLFDAIPTHYYQELNRLIDRTDAYAEYPLPVKRIRGRRRSRGAHIARTIGGYGLLSAVESPRRSA